MCSRQQRRYRNFADGSTYVTQWHGDMVLTGHEPLATDPLNRVAIHDALR